MSMMTCAVQKAEYRDLHKLYRNRDQIVQSLLATISTASQLVRTTLIDSTHINVMM